MAHAGLAELAGERAAADERRGAHDREERALGARIADVVAHAAATEKTLYGGTVRVTKELQGLQQDLDAWKAKRRALEAEEFVLLERGEALDAGAEALDAREAALRAQIAGFEAAISAAVAATEVELERLAGERSGVVPAVAAPLLAAYEKIRLEPRLHGVAAARFDGTNCRGCNTAIPIVDATRIQREAAAAVVQCPRCRRLLVR